MFCEHAYTHRTFDKQSIIVGFPLYNCPYKNLLLVKQARFVSEIKCILLYKLHFCQLDKLQKAKYVQSEPSVDWFVRTFLNIWFSSMLIVWCFVTLLIFMCTLLLVNSKEFLCSIRNTHGFCLNIQFRLAILGTLFYIYSIHVFFSCYYVSKSGFT